VINSKFQAALLSSDSGTGVLAQDFEAWDGGMGEA
jgi:hypothetical protein